MTDDLGLGDEGTLVLEQRFAILPEWIIDAPISDCAFRLYAVLLRYGQTSGRRMPGRALLARRLHKSSKDTVDRALRELVGIGAVVVERRRAGRQNLTNRYHVRTSATGRDNPLASMGAKQMTTTDFLAGGGAMGAVMSSVRGTVAGRADGGRIAAMVRSKLSAG